MQSFIFLLLKIFAADIFRKFSIESRLSGNILVTVTNIKDNNSLVTIIEGKIADIIRSLPNQAALGFTVQKDVS